MGQMLVNDAVQRAARQRHAARRAHMCSPSMLAIIFIVRLRRFVSGTLGWLSFLGLHCYIWLRLLLETRIGRAPELRLLQLE